MADPAIDIQEFSKSYGSLQAVKRVSLQVRQGEIYGLIGPDGAGKTTLLRAVCTLLKPDSGRIRVNGADTTSDFRQVRRRIGYMPQRFSLYTDLTVEQNLQFFADLFQVPSRERPERLSQLYQFSRLEPFRKRLAGALSGGMKQKLALSCALIHTPEVLVLDEPTFGVDPVSREEFWEILQSIRQEGTAILVSTAYMEEADLCGRVSLMHRGELVSSGTPRELRQQYPYPLYRLQGENLRELQRFFREMESVHSTQLFGDALHVSFQHDPQEREWRSWQKQQGENLRRWKAQAPDIEDIFMQMMSESDENK
ncbi:MAG: ABC transporter ATP-binding protein [Calditrichia bacterium]